MKASKFIIVALALAAALFALSSCAECSHSNTETVTISEASCTSDGITQIMCKDCGTILRLENIDKLAHTEVVDAAVDGVVTLTRMESALLVDTAHDVADLVGVSKQIAFGGSEAFGVRGHL